MRKTRLIVKGISVIVIALSIALQLGFSSVKANTICEPIIEENQPTDDELLHLEGQMTEMGYYGNGIDVDLLYNNNGEASYLLATSNKGYMIFDRNRNIICECGEGNPYSACMSSIKVYGGPFCYYLVDEGNSKNEEGLYLNLLTNKHENYPKTVVFIEEKDSTKSDQAQTRTETTHRVANSLYKIKRKAFGFNDDDSCGAVAVGIVLYYLKAQHGIDVVPNKSGAEDVNYGIPTSRTDNGQKYPNAQYIHTHIQVYYYMGSLMYGANFKNKINDYLTSEVSASNRPTVSYTIAPNYNTIMSHIDANKPVIITSTIAGEYSWHNMVVYGYKITNDNEKLILVHTGWYTSEYMIPFHNVNAFRSHKDVWLNKSYATYAYYFTLPGE